MRQTLVIIMMGVSGSGKSTVGRMLAEALHLPFYDGDDYHPAENVAKMRAGIPLDDADRYIWLEQLHALARKSLQENGAVIACSALKETYRKQLSDGAPHGFKWILLEGDYDLIKSRIQARSGHYMPVDLLPSQFATLEIPEYAFSVSIDQSPESIVTQIMNSLASSEIGIVGLGVMGRALALNFASKGIALSLYNRHVPDKEEHVAQHLISANTELSDAKGFDDIAAFVSSLARPRKILLMVEAGHAVDAVIEQLIPLLAHGDVITDCGNSHYTDTERRMHTLANHHIHFLGTGVSGGEHGARFGPSIMPGGSKSGYALFQSAFEHIAAKDKNNLPCCNYIGDGGAGHFVKMVHNGIEYAEMQLIAEVYGTLRYGYGFNPDGIAKLFEQWLTGIHQSFLLDITVQILRAREDDSWVLDKISDASQSKGTGAWTLQAAHELGVASPVIAAAVHARFLSGNIGGRAEASKIYQDLGRHVTPLDEDRLGDGFYLARLINHHLGFDLLREASKAYHWNLDLQEIARIWTNGCIIRSSLMETLREILPASLLLHPSVYEQAKEKHGALIDLIVSGTSHQIHLPCHSAALNFLNGFTINQPTGNLIQAQRDMFGAHGFLRIDDPSWKTYHF